MAAEGTIIVKRWPPEFRLCFNCHDKPVSINGAFEGLCHACDEAKNRNERFRLMARDYDAEYDDDFTLGLYPRRIL